jgi:glyoxylase-like metal-dependent hydrolase (beta-lactamase superfamily II)
VAGVGAAGRHFRIAPVADGVWSAVARDGGYALCNAGIFDLGGRTVVFDSMLTPMAGALLARAAERLTGRPADVVVNSHWHGDHLRGNSAFAPAPIASTRRTRRLVQTRGRAQWRSDLQRMPAELQSLEHKDSPIPKTERALFRGWFRGTLEVPRPFAPVPADLTFEGELRIVGRRRALRLITYGGGHSPSDAFAIEPESGTVCFGDLLSVGLHPSVTDGDPRAWRRMLQRIRRLPLRQAIPGHGPPGDARDVLRLERYLAELERRGRAIREHRTPPSVWRAEPPPAEFQGWKFSMFYPENVARAFRLSRVGPARR